MTTKPIRSGKSTQSFDTSRLTALLGYRLTRADLLARKFFVQSMAPFGLRPAEYSVLILVLANERINQKNLGQALAISAPNLAVLLDRLEERGLMCRAQDDTDRRSQHLFITASGRALVETAERVLTEMDQDMARILSDPERLMLMQLLEKFSSRDCGQGPDSSGL